MKTHEIFVGISAVLLISGCGESDSLQDIAPLRVIDAQEVDNLMSQLKNDLVWVKGGTFKMGDFGAQYGARKGYIDMDEDSRPVHDVELSSFSISTYKITNHAYQIYLGASGLRPREDLSERIKRYMTVPNLPATIDWHEANAFCAWVAIQTGLPFALPTEAQWEYAARSRGEFVPVSTDTGDWDIYYVGASSYDEDMYRGKNISTDGNRMDYSQSQGWSRSPLSLMPVDSFPPNPLGLYSMTDNGYEWVWDWYDPNYYSVSPQLNPQGPAQPVFRHQGEGEYPKVLRGVHAPDAGWRMGYTVSRNFSPPLALLRGHVSLGDKTARCAVNTPTPITSSPRPGTH